MGLTLKYTENFNIQFHSSNNMSKADLLIGDK